MNDLQEPIQPVVTAGGVQEIPDPAEEKTEEEEREAVAKETYEAEAGLYIPPEEKKEDEE